MKKLKLNKLANNQLKEKEMSFLNGGEIDGNRVHCGCGCCYANNGGSSIDDNGQRNAAYGKVSQGCTIVRTIDYLKDDR